MSGLSASASMRATGGDRGACCARMPRPVEASRRGASFCKQVHRPDMFSVASVPDAEIRDAWTPDGRLIRILFPCHCAACPRAPGPCWRQILPRVLRNRKGDGAFLIDESAMARRAALKPPARRALPRHPRHRVAWQAARISAPAQHGAHGALGAQDLASPCRQQDRGSWTRRPGVWLVSVARQGALWQPSAAAAAASSRKIWHLSVAAPAATPFRASLDRSGQKLTQCNDIACALVACKGLNFWRAQHDTKARSIQVHGQRPSQFPRQSHSCRCRQARQRARATAHAAYDRLVGHVQAL